MPLSRKDTKGHKVLMFLILVKLGALASLWQKRIFLVSILFFYCSKKISEICSQS
jgi:hypothetical protein